MNQIITLLEAINPFRKTTAAQLAKTTLEDYERNLIVSESAAAYNRKMTEFYREGISRLRSQAAAQAQFPALVA